jgi:hypothetical protein
VCTIHSPTSQSFRLFAKLYLMADGQAVFFGDPHTTAIPHFERCGFKFQVGDSVADYCIYITGGGTKGTSGYDFAAAYESSPLKSAADEQMRLLVHDPFPRPRSQHNIA